MVLWQSSGTWNSLFSDCRSIWSTSFISIHSDNCMTSMSRLRSSNRDTLLESRAFVCCSWTPEVKQRENQGISKPVSSIAKTHATPFAGYRALKGRQLRLSALNMPILELASRWFRSVHREKSAQICSDLLKFVNCVLETNCLNFNFEDQNLEILGSKICLMKKTT